MWFSLSDGLQFASHILEQDNVIQSENEISKKRQLWEQGKQLF